MVKQSIKPISKLIILFLVFIIIPGLVLSYLSIQNIAIQAELIEKRLLEKQGQLAMMLAENFQQQLENYAIKFFQIADSLGSDRKDQISSLNALDYTEQVFVVDRKGRFMHPFLFIEGPATQKRYNSGDFLDAFNEAEQLEFNKRSLKAATVTFREAIKTSANRHEEAMAVNGLARVLTKRKLYDLACKQYKLLAERYGEEIDRSGIPFAYYSLHQLNSMPVISGDERTRIIQFILSSLNQDKIPLTDHVEIILHELHDSYGRHDRTGRILNREIVHSIGAIQKKSQFANRGAKLIQRFIEGNLTPEPKSITKDFVGITGNFDNAPVLLVINSSQSSEQMYGFQFNLEVIKAKVLADISNLPTEFEFAVRLVSKGQMERTEINEFSLIRDLSPLVPLWQISVEPANPDIISQYIITRRWVYSVTLVLLIFGMFLGIFLVFRDMSREKTMGQLRSDFVSNVTHELKTPLTSIRMFAETMLLGRQKSKKELQEYLSIIVNESARLTRLINNVLDFAKIEKNRKEYHFECINLSAVVRSAVNSMTYWLSEQGFKMEVKIEPDIKTKADGDAIEQAVLNLLSNAMKYSFKHKEINLDLYAKDHSIFIQVGDKGIGIPEKEQKHIFDKYYRVPVHNQGDKGGAGLGLTVVKHIVDAHRGTIVIESRVNRGSTFTIILPQNINESEDRLMG